MHSNTRKHAKRECSTLKIKLIWRFQRVLSNSRNNVASSGWEFNDWINFYWNDDTDNELHGLTTQMRHERKFIRKPDKQNEINTKLSSTWKRCPHWLRVNLFTYEYAFRSVSLTLHRYVFKTHIHSSYFIKPLFHLICEMKKKLKYLHKHMNNFNVKCSSRRALESETEKANGTVYKYPANTLVACMIVRHKTKQHIFQVR